MAPQLETIATLITPVGQGGIGVVQVSGPCALSIADRVFMSPRGKRLVDAPANTLHYGHVVGPDERVIDEVIVRVVDARASWLGEPTVEINCHGGVAAVRAILDAVAESGALRVPWTDVGLRAFRRGRIDAVQLEAWWRLPTAATSLAADMLLAQWCGALSQAVQEALAGGCPIGPLVQTARVGIALCEPAKVVIAGRPNVGKSTLFNALVAEERALVHDRPGTTRDYVSALVEIRGVPLELIDTAGVRRPADAVEALGIELARSQMDNADLVLMLADTAPPTAPEARAALGLPAGRPLVVGRTKADLEPGTAGAPPGCVSVSGTTGEGLQALEGQILLSLLGAPRPACDGAVVFTQRQVDCLSSTDPVCDKIRHLLHDEPAPRIPRW